jgi:uncharacterized PurR-regulated membrane protein YhhQ (DUF165 family)
MTRPDQPHVSHSARPALPALSIPDRRVQRFTALAMGVLYVACVMAANTLTAQLGMLPVGFGLSATAGTWAAGLALAARDSLHEAAGIRAVLAAILLGAAVSGLTAGARLALASGATFAAAETLDLAVYTPLRRRGRRRAVAASNLAGALADTLLFFALAGLPLTAATLAGQLLVKAVWTTAVWLVAGEVTGRVVFRQRQHRADSRRDAPR